MKPVAVLEHFGENCAVAATTVKVLGNFQVGILSANSTHKRYRCFEY